MIINYNENQKNSMYFQSPNYKKLVSETMIENIRKVEYFSKTPYVNLNIAETLTFYTNRYVRQLLDFTSVSKNTIIADVGAGFGWLSMAFIYSTEAKVIAIEKNEARLKASKEIADILGIGDKIDWRVGALGSLPLQNREADVVYCIEVLEHVYKSRAAIHDLCRVSKDLLIITTPNLWFPVIAHDTQLPFCHWLPIPIRKVYAKMFNRTNKENDNLFWSPYSLRICRTSNLFPNGFTIHHTRSSRRHFPFTCPMARVDMLKN